MILPFHVSKIAPTIGEEFGQQNTAIDSVDFAE